MPRWWASISGADSAAGSDSIPSAVESATSARSTPSLAELRPAQTGIDRDRGEHAVGLARDPERPPLIAAHQRRGRGPALERLDQLLAEQMLVDVNVSPFLINPIKMLDY